MIAWTLNDALEFIRDRQAGAEAAGYYLALAGGVLNRGSSFNDLDVVAVPRTADANPVAHGELLALFSTTGCRLVSGEKAGVTVVYKIEVDYDAENYRQLDLIVVARNGSFPGFIG